MEKKNVHLWWTFFFWHVLITENDIYNQCWAKTSIKHEQNKNDVFRCFTFSGCKIATSQVAVV